MAKLKDLSKELKKSVGKAEKGIKKGLKGAEKGIKEIGEKASDSVKIFELQKEISKHEDEVQSLKSKIGEKALAMAAKGSNFEPELMKLVNKAQGLQAKIKDIKATIKKIKVD